MNIFWDTLYIILCVFFINHKMYKSWDGQIQESFNFTENTTCIFFVAADGPQTRHQSMKQANQFKILPMKEIVKFISNTKYRVACFLCYTTTLLLVAVECRTKYVETFNHACLFAKMNAMNEGV